MTKFVIEVLKEINDNPASMPNHINNQALKIALEHTFNPEGKFILPDTDPPYKEDAAPLGMSPGNFQQECKKMYVFCRADLKPIKREQLFIGLLENVHPTEAKLLLAIKNQDISKLFPNITHHDCFVAGLVTVPASPRDAVTGMPKSVDTRLPRGRSKLTTKAGKEFAETHQVIA